MPLDKFVWEDFHLDGAPNKYQAKLNRKSVQLISLEDIIDSPVRIISEEQHKDASSYLLEIADRSKTNPYFFSEGWDQTLHNNGGTFYVSITKSYSPLQNTNPDIENWRSMESIEINANIIDSGTVTFMQSTAFLGNDLIYPIQPLTWGEGNNYSEAVLSFFAQEQLDKAGTDMQKLTAEQSLWTPSHYIEQITDLASKLYKRL